MEEEKSSTNKKKNSLEFSLLSNANVLSKEDLPIYNRNIRYFLISHLFANLICSNKRQFLQMKERTNSVSRGREKCAKILMQLQNTHLSHRLPTTKTLVPCQINSFHYNKGNHNIILQ